MSSESSQVVRYGSTALAAGALHNDMVSRKQELRLISQTLPPGSEAVVKFLVVADLNPAGQSGTDPQIYHAATAHFRTLPNKKFVVSATISTYVTGAYQQRVSREDLERSPPNSESINALVPTDASSREIVVLRHPLMSGENEKAFDSMDAKERCPEATNIVNVVKRMFVKGVPLPSDQRFHYCTFTVMVRIPNESLQYLVALRGTRGTKDPRNQSEGSWNSTSVQDFDYSNNDGHEADLEKRFGNLKAEACDGARPSDIPEEARQTHSDASLGLLPREPKPVQEIE